MEVIAMPKMDGTGPMGQGPMTGRCFGICYDEKSDKPMKVECGLALCGCDLANRHGFGRGNRGRNGRQRV